MGRGAEWRADTQLENLGHVLRIRNPERRAVNENITRLRIRIFPEPFWRQRSFPKWKFDRETSEGKSRKASKRDMGNTATEGSAGTENLEEKAAWVWKAMKPYHTKTMEVLQINYCQCKTAGHVLSRRLQKEQMPIFQI